MVDDRPPTLFETARAELRAIGVDLTMHPGTWCVNFRGASAETAYVTDDLPDAIEHGREMAESTLARFVARGQAAQRAVDKIIIEATAGTPARRRRRVPPARTAKAHNRRLRKQHMRKLRARAARMQKNNQDELTADRGAEGVNPSKKTDDIPPA